jgi:hypothetical protein
MTAPSVYAVGAVTTGDSSDIDSVAVPAGSLTGKLVCLFTMTDGDSIPASTGWTSVVTGASSSGPLGARVSVLYRRFTGSEGANITVTIDPPNLYNYVMILVAFSDVVSAGNPIGVVGSVHTGASQDTVALSAITTPNADNLVIGVGVSEDDVADDVNIAFSGTTPVLSSISTQYPAISTFTALGIFGGTKATAGSIGTQNVTYTAAPRDSAAVLFSLLSLSNSNGTFALVLTGS